MSGLHLGVDVREVGDLGGRGHAVEHLHQLRNTVRQSIEISKGCVSVQPASVRPPCPTAS